MNKSAISYFKYQERAMALVGVPFSRRKEFSEWGVYKKDLIHPDTGNTFSGWVIALNKWEQAKEALGL